MRAFTTTLAAAAAFLAAPARANAPAPEMYSIDEPAAGTVVIDVLNYAERACPDEGLLRRNVDTGEIVRITTCQGDAFLDECVPAGNYQYGLAEPLVCNETTGTQYYGEQTVTVGAGESCTRTVDAPVPAESVPWTTDQWVCTSSYHGPGEDGGSGCNTGGAVLGTNLLVLVAGLALWRRRIGRRGA